ncbi:hypothetical protein AGLY_004761 [Aphis glycines]|uniref:Uncharacterized protein n=1 Tax=Aphis glycines TaxID=307491 RepID=A0A6G0TX41_APHGL|nr:hypothetical protein AGLY_004761 [Aphis glycines]
MLLQLFHTSTKEFQCNDSGSSGSNAKAVSSASSVQTVKKVYNDFKIIDHQNLSYQRLVLENIFVFAFDIPIVPTRHETRFVSTWKRKFALSTVLQLDPIFYQKPPLKLNTSCNVTESGSFHKFRTCKRNYGMQFILFYPKSVFPYVYDFYWHTSNSYINCCLALGDRSEYEYGFKMLPLYCARATQYDD